MGAVLVRFGLFADLTALFGLACFGLYALRGSERRSGATLRFSPLLAGTALIGILLSIADLFSLAASMGGVPMASVDRALLSTVLWDTGVGTALQVRIVALLLATLFGLLGIRTPMIALNGVAGAGAVALGGLAWSGHGAMDEGTVGWVHLVADLSHLFAAGIWIGALFALTMLVFRPAARIGYPHLVLSHRALASFSTVGTVVVATILVSGLINSWILVGPDKVISLPNSLYGQLLIAKLALFAAMIILAAANRFRLTPAFEGAIAAGDHIAALSALRRSLVIETGCAVAILALVGWLGTLAPPASGM